jgi:hypothetical protein
MTKITYIQMKRASSGAFYEVGYSDGSFRQVPLKGMNKQKRIATYNEIISA